MTRVVVFAGQSKTGTTTLQQHLLASAPTLRRHGVLYPATGRRGAAHHPAAAAFLAGAAPAWVQPLDSAAWRAALDGEIAAAGAHTALLASEFFFHADCEALARTLHGHDVRVVVALRRQDLFLDASAQQKLKTLQFRAIGDAWLQKRVGSPRLDYDAVLRRWEAAFGADALRILPFEADLLAGGLVHRLFALAGIEPWPEMAEPAPANLRLSRDALALLQALHFDAGIDRRRAMSLRPALAEYSLAHPDPPEWRYVLPPALRRQVRADAQAGNAAIHARHPWPGRAALFLDTAVDSAFAPYPGLSAEAAARLRDFLAPRGLDPELRAAVAAAAQRSA